MSTIFRFSKLPMVLSDNVFPRLFSASKAISAILVSSLIFVPEWRVSLLPASMLTFLPQILMSPLGALMVMPVKAPISTLPYGLLILTLRSCDDSDSSYSPKRSPM